jgi:hypothetical protein
MVFVSSGCFKKTADPRLILIGKWQSSRLVTPLYLYENGEWEIKRDDGAVLQYGVWEFKNNSIFWTHKSGGLVISDVNPVLQMQTTSFLLSENDHTITSFKKID